MDRLIIVSMDGHAQLPTEVWPEYLEKRYHEYLPQLIEENKWYTAIMRGLLGRSHGENRLPEFDFDNAVRDGGTWGLWNRDTRIAEMDREGVAAEVITGGDGRVCAIGYEPTNQVYPLDLCQAGLKAYHRWVADEFGNDGDRLKLITNTGRAPWRDVHEMVGELDWCADHGFVATSIPGHTIYPHQPALFDHYWDPFWARAQKRGMWLWMHAGHGEVQGEYGRELARIHRGLVASQSDMNNLVGQVKADAFDDGKAFMSIKPRRGIWQLMLSGMFDRFPKLKLVTSEIHADWLPATLAMVDEAWEKNRNSLPAKRKPSEYWSEHCLNGVSFLRKCDIDERHNFGAHTLAFGRDYPHTEATWPNTKQWLREVFDGVPGEEIKAIAGGNAIDFLGWDKARLKQIAEDIKAPTLEEITGMPRAGETLIRHFNERGTHFSAKPEGTSRVPEMSGLLREDLWQLSVAA